MLNKNLIVIVGPTAVGKTALSIDVAKHFETEIVSADSRQFFKELNIGTAKPSPVELKEVRHHFIDSHSIEETVNIGKYEVEALQIIESLFQKKDIVILTGGSGLYINAVCNGLDELPEGNEELRAELNKRLITEGIISLQNQLKELDETYYNQVDLGNPHRIIRAIEVSITTGKPYSSFRNNVKKSRPFNIIKIGLNLPRELLYERINLRVDNMISEGLVEEVKALESKQHLNSLQTVGYTELFQYFNNELSLEEAIEKIKQNSRRYAKRQLTWFGKDKEIKWFEPREKEEVIGFIQEKASTKN